MVGLIIALFAVIAVPFVGAALWTAIERMEVEDDETDEHFWGTEEDWEGTNSEAMTEEEFDEVAQYLATKQKT